MRGIYILFSGGYDSSYLVNRILEDLKSKNDKDTTVNLISVNPNFSYKKAEREHDVRNILINYWKSKYYDLIINYSELKIDIYNFHVKSNRTGLIQPQFWLSSLLTSVDLTTYDEVDILFSYILGDQALFFRKEIENICRDTLEISDIRDNSISTIFNISDKVKINIKFPLAFIEKYEILSMLINDDEFVFDNCTTCESVDDNFCGECTPCIHLQQTLNNIINSNKINNEKVKEKCSKLLEKIKNKRLEKYKEDKNCVDNIHCEKNEEKVC